MDDNSEDFEYEWKIKIIRKNNKGSFTIILFHLFPYMPSAIVLFSYQSTLNIDIDVYHDNQFFSFVKLYTLNKVINNMKIHIGNIQLYK